LVGRCEFGNHGFISLPLSWAFSFFSNPRRNHEP
jgi:hypothetical protein